MELGEKIKELRNKQGLTQEELADRAELSKGFISQLERDMTSPSIATLEDLLQCLGTTLGEFFMEEQEEEQKKSASRRVTGSPRKSSTSEQFPYTPMSDEDTWLSCYDAVSKFSCQYPTNWYKITGTKAPTPDSEPPLLKLVNGGSQLTVTSNSYDTQDEFERMKKLLLTLPRNEQGKPSEDYKQSKVNINGLPMTKTTNPLRIGHPDEEGEEMQQTVLLYFQENKRRVFAIVMLVADEKAQADLDAITSSIQIEK